MPTYAVHYTYTDDTDARLAARPGHREFLTRLADEGVCLAAGAYAPHEAPGGLLIFRADTADELARRLADDPYATGGFIADTRIVEWGPAVGPVASALA